MFGARITRVIATEPPGLTLYGKLGETEISVKPGVSRVIWFIECVSSMALLVSVNVKENVSPAGQIVV